MNTKLFYIIFPLVLLSACEDKTISIDEFRKDIPKALEYKAKCRNGELKFDSATCRNARAALRSKGISNSAR